MKSDLPHLPLTPSADRFGRTRLCWTTARTDGGSTVQVAERADSWSGESGAREIDPQAIFDYLHFHCIPAPRTIFRGVHRLPAGHRLEIEGDTARVEADADADADALAADSPPPTRAPQDFDSLRARFIALLERAVQRQLDGSRPACFLSGGTDSSTVAAFIGRVTGRPAATFSIGFDAQGYDEMAYARIAAKAFGTDHHEYYVTPDDLVATIAQVAASFDQPFGNSSVVPAYCCALQARAKGVTRLLAGDGGDELFGGNSRYAKQKVFGAYGRVPGLLRRGLVEPLLLDSALGRLPLLRKGASYVRQSLVPMPARMDTYNMLHLIGVQQVLEPRFLEQVDTAVPAAHQQAVWDSLRAPSELDRMLAYDWRYTLAESDLPKVQGAVGLAGLTAGFPLLDDDLVAFSRALPPHYKVRGLRLRWFFKEALRGILPPEIITKKKQGFGLPFGVWATGHSALRRLAEDSVQGTVDRGLVKSDFARTLMRDLLPSRPGYFGEMIWILMMLEQWMRVHAPDYRA